MSDQPTVEGPAMNDPDRRAEAKGDHLYEARLVRDMLAKRAPLTITDKDGTSVVVSLPSYDWLIAEVERLQRLPLVGEVERLQVLVKYREDTIDKLKAEVERWTVGYQRVAHADEEVERLRERLRELATETLLARAVIHELTWGEIVITEHPRLAATLRAWGEGDKIGTPELKRLAEEDQ